MSLGDDAPPVRVTEKHRLRPGQNRRPLMEGLEPRTHFNAASAAISSFDESPTPAALPAFEDSAPLSSALAAPAGLAAALDLTGKWEVQGFDAIGTFWIGHMVVYQGVEASDGLAPLEGHFDWEVNGIARGREYFRGTFDPFLRRVEILGHTLENPIELNVDHYFANVSEDGARLLDGRWEGHGSIPSDNWSGYQVTALEDSVVKTPPAAPPGIYASEVGGGHVVVSWVDGSSDEAFFKVERALSPDGDWTVVGTTGANTTTYTDAGLAANTTYYYRVSAISAGGVSGASNTFAAITADPPMRLPTAPRKLAANGASATEVTLTWVDRSKDETAFAIERALTPDGPWTLVGIAPADTGSFSSAGLSPRTTYYHRIRAAGAGGPGAYTKPAVTSTFALPGTEAPPFDIVSVTTAGPASVIGGGKGRAMVRVQNAAPAGAAPARGYVMLSASADTTLDAGDTPMLHAAVPVRLRPGRGRSLRLKAVYPTGVPDGSYYLIAHASERSETIFNAKAPAVALAPTPLAIVPPKVILTGTSLAPDSTTLIRGGRAFATLLVTNAGNVRYSGTVSTDLAASVDAATDTPGDNTPLGLSNRRISLRPGQTKRIRIEFGAAAAALPPGPVFLAANISAAPLASGLIPIGSVILSDGVLTINE